MNAPSVPARGAIVIAFIESPLQAFNLVEYCTRHAVDPALIYLTENSELSQRNRAQIEHSLERLPSFETVFLSSPLRRGNLRRRRSEVGIAAETIVFAAGGKPMVLITGEYRSLFFWSVVRRLRSFTPTSVVLDDGTAMLRVDRNRQLGMREILKVILLRCLGLSPFIASSKSIFFTTFDIQHRLRADDSLLPNDYRSYRHEIAKLPVDDESVFIIGSPLLEAGVVKDDHDLTLLLLRRTKEMFPGYRLRYIAHRRERPEKLALVRAQVEVEELEEAFEQYPVKARTKPRYVTGYYSSVYINLAAIYGDSIALSAIRIHGRDIVPEWRKFVGEIYESYARLYPGIIQVLA